MLIDVNHLYSEDINSIQINFDGRQQFYVEEDKVNWMNNTLARNFSGCYMIKAMLEAVYIAGQKNEPVEIQVNIIRDDI